MVMDYIDDMVIKIREASDHVKDLEKVFRVFQWYNIKLNPQNCAFGVSSGQFLGHIVSLQGMEASPTKLRNFFEIQEPWTVCNIQSLTGKITALSRFVSKMSDKCKPFFNSIRPSNSLIWEKKNKQVSKVNQGVHEHHPNTISPSWRRRTIVISGNFRGCSNWHVGQKRK